MPIVDFGDPASVVGQYNVSTGIWLIKGQVWRQGEPPVMSRFEERKEVRLEFSRALMLGFCDNRAKLLVAGLGLSATDKVLLVGAGFGWLAECLKNHVPGITVVCTDTSAWVQADKGKTETAQIEAWVQAAGILPIMTRYQECVDALDDRGTIARVLIGTEDVLMLEDRAKLKQVHGAFTWAITETLFTGLTDAECIEIDTAMREVTSKVAHIVQPYSHKFDGKTEPEPVWNWKLLEATGRGVRQQLLDQPWYTKSNWKSLLPNSTFVGVGGGVV